MVDRKKPRIARKPKATPPEADQWITQGGIDPESSGQVSTDSREQVMMPEPEQEQGKAYPHRISFDMATPQYKRLKWASFDSDRTMNEILREAVEDWMKVRDY